MRERVDAIFLQRDSVRGCREKRVVGVTFLGFEVKRMSTPQAVVMITLKKDILSD